MAASCIKCTLIFHNIKGCIFDVCLQHYFRILGGKYSINTVKISLPSLFAALADAPAGGRALDGGHGEGLGVGVLRGHRGRGQPVQQHLDIEMCNI